MPQERLQGRTQTCSGVSHQFADNNAQRSAGATSLWQDEQSKTDDRHDKMHMLRHVLVRGCSANIGSLQGPNTAASNSGKQKYLALGTLSFDGAHHQVHCHSSSVPYDRTQHAAGIPEDPTAPQPQPHLRWAAQLLQNHCKKSAGPTCGRPQHR